jgi:hypothetical protein
MNILFGQNLKGFADLLRGKVNDPIVLAYNVVGIFVIAVFCGLGAWGARRALRSLEAHQREQRAQQAALEAAAAEVEAKAGVKEAALGDGEGGIIKAEQQQAGVPRVVASDASAPPTAAASSADGEQQEQEGCEVAAPALLPRRSRGDSEGGPGQA